LIKCQKGFPHRLTLIRANLLPHLRKMTSVVVNMALVMALNLILCLPL